MGKRGRRRNRVHDNSSSNGCCDQPQTCSIAIIGSGLTGLASALLLARTIDDNKITSKNDNDDDDDERQELRQIDIYERDASFEARKEGYGLTLTYNPVGILNELGILDEIADADCPSRSHFLFKQDEDESKSEVIGYYGNAFADATATRISAADEDTTRTSETGGGWGQRGNLRVPRQRVRQLLFQKLQKEASHVRIHWNHRLINLAETKAHDGDGNSGSMELEFDVGKGTTIKAKAGLVIAADGIHSAVVQNWLPTVSPPQSLGVSIILGITGPPISYNATATTTEEEPDLVDADQTKNNDSIASHKQHFETKYPDLYHERGYYTLAKHKRLFVMPFSSPTLDNPNEPVRYMWQLSYADPSVSDKGEQGLATAEAETKSHAQTPTSAQQLRQKALQLTQNWHNPVQQMIQSTSLETVWGTLLKDRDPIEIQQALQNKQGIRRVIVAGDALHAMSPFKGQGANNCLLDAKTIAKWFSTSSMNTESSTTTANSRKRKERRSPSFEICVKGCMRELVQRTAAVVASSRRAAQFWHSPEALEEQHKFATYLSSSSSSNNNDPQLLVQELQRRDMQADTPELEQTIRTVIQSLDINNVMVLQEQKVNSTKQINNSNVRNKDKEQMRKHTLERAYQASCKGNLGELRRILWYNQNLLRNHTISFSALETRDQQENGNTESLLFAESQQHQIQEINTNSTTQNENKNGDQRLVGVTTTCLHGAAANGHLKVIHWLVSEAGCSLHARDHPYGRSPRQVAGSDAVTRLLDQLESKFCNRVDHFSTTENNRLLVATH